MFSTSLARLFRRRPTRTPTARRFRPRLEGLDERVVPAWDVWMGYDANGLQLWSLHRAPSYGDDAVFDGNYSNASVIVGVIGPWNSLQLINGYSGTVDLNSSIQVNTLTQSSGTVTWDLDREDVFISQAWTWTGGTLNASSHANTVHVGSGATATLSPGAGNTVNTGDTISFESSGTSGSFGTFNVGVFNFTNGGSIIMNGYCTVTAKPVTVNSTVKYVGVSVIQLAANDTFQLTGPGTMDGTGVPIYNAGGTVKLDGSATVQLGGALTIGGTKYNNSYYQSGSGSTLDIQSGSFLNVANPALVTDGTLQTSYNGNLPDTVAGQTATITGDLSVTGGKVVICAGGGAGITHYGTLAVTGAVTFIGGSYNPYIDGTMAGHNDQWTSGGNFTVNGVMGSTATIAPVTVGQVGANQTWVIIKAAVGKTFTGNFVNPTLAYAPGKSFTVGTIGNPANGFTLNT